jgi:hypothetical protein
VEARTQWERHFGSALSVPIDVVINAFLPITSDDDQVYLRQLHTNFKYLCSPWMNQEGIITNRLSIDAFISFFHCFGSPIGVRVRLQEITPLYKPFSNYPLFFIGICLGVNKSRFSKSWTFAMAESWALIDGEKPATFKLITRESQCDDGNDRTWTVWIDATNLKTPFSFKITEDSQLIQVESLQSILTSLNIEKDSGLRLNEMEMIKQSDWPGASPFDIPSPSQFYDDFYES